MKKGFICGIALAALVAAPAMAADLPARVYTKAPPPPPVTYLWTGCYIGANGGYGWADKDWYDPQVGANEGSHTATGGVVGGQLGCDYQTGNVVFGLQAMGDWASLEGSHPYTDDPRYTDHSRVSAFATFTGRIGYAIQPAMLVYLKGGGAWVRDKFTETCSPLVDTCPAVDKVSRSGWTFGGGLEYMFLPNWSGFVEYNYMDFGRHTSTLVYTDLTTYDYDIKQNVQTILVGLNYRFGAGPIAARY